MHTESLKKPRESLGIKKNTTTENSPFAAILGSSVTKSDQIPSGGTTSSDCETESKRTLRVYD